MTAGIQANPNRIDENLTNLATQLRDICQQIKNLNTQINGQGNGTTYLQGINYPDPATALQLLGLLNNISGVYFGTATVAADYNFDNGLAPLWGGLIT